jgi:hypothetical protein
MSVDQKPAPDMQDEFSPKMHDVRETIHFVAATELVLFGQLKPDTVELLVLLAPQPTVAFKPPAEGSLYGNLIVAFAGAGAAFSKNTAISAMDDAATGGKVQIKAEDETTRDIAKAAKLRLQNLIHQRNAAVSAHMKSVREKRSKLN